MVLYLIYGDYYSTDFSKLKSKFEQKWVSKFDKKLKIFKRIREEKSAGLTKGFGRVTLLLYEQNANATKKRVSCMRLLQRIPGAERDEDKRAEDGFWAARMNVRLFSIKGFPMGNGFAISRDGCARYSVRVCRYPQRSVSCANHKKMSERSWP